MKTAPMKTSPNGVLFISNEEGWVDHVYKDIAGVPTIGFGHALRPGETFPATITKEQGLAILANDLYIAEAGVNHSVLADLNQNQFDALVSFTFNLGTGALASSHLLIYLNQGNFAAAADQFLVWDKVRKNGVLVDDVGLENRRKAERQMFLKPVDQPTPEPTPTPEPKPLPEPSISSGFNLQALLDFILKLFRLFRKK